MMSRLFSLLGVMFLFGCASEQRLGESRIQAKRHSKGVYIQHHRDHVRPQDQPLMHASDERGDMQPAQALPVYALTETVTPRLANWQGPVHHGRGGLSAARQLPLVEAWEAPASIGPIQKTEQAEGGFGSRPHIAQAEPQTLPDPIDGRHPNAVPGFILSMGWALGLIAEGAIAYLQIPIAGLAAVLGILSTIAGYFLSRKSFRMSLAHPELYPRFKLSRAARWVAAAVFTPVAFYAFLIVIAIILLGGL